MSSRSSSSDDGDDADDRGRLASSSDDGDDADDRGRLASYSDDGDDADGLSGSRVEYAGDHAGSEVSDLDDDQSDSTATPSVMSFPPLPSGTEIARPPAATPLPLANLPDAEIVARNRQLLAKLQEALPSPEAFQHFKSVSQAFQRGDISAASFYETLINSCGSRSSEIFGDLVALLPHAQRRSELIAVHQSMLEQHAGEMGIQTASFPSLSQTTDVPKPTSVRSYAKIHSVPASADSGAWPSLAAQGNTTVPPALDTGWGIPNTASSSTHSYGSSADEEQRRRKNKKGKKVLLHFG